MIKDCILRVGFKANAQSIAYLARLGGFFHGVTAHSDNAFTDYVPGFQHLHRGDCFFQRECLAHVGFNFSGIRQFIDDSTIFGAFFRIDPAIFPCTHANDR